MPELYATKEETMRKQWPLPLSYPSYLLYRQHCRSPVPREPHEREKQVALTQSNPIQT